MSFEEEKIQSESSNGDSSDDVGRVNVPLKANTSFDGPHPQFDENGEIVESGCLVASGDEDQLIGD